MQNEARDEVGYSYKTDHNGEKTEENRNDDEHNRTFFELYKNLLNLEK